jgi:hypothetical protein
LVVLASSRSPRLRSFALLHCQDFISHPVGEVFQLLTQPLHFAEEAAVDFPKFVIAEIFPMLFQQPSRLLQMPTRCCKWCECGSRRRDEIVKARKGGDRLGGTCWFKGGGKSEDNGRKTMMGTFSTSDAQFGEPTLTMRPRLTKTKKAPELYRSSSPCGFSWTRSSPKLRVAGYFRTRLAERWIRTISPTV